MRHGYAPHLYLHRSKICRATSHWRLSTVHLPTFDRAFCNGFRFPKLYTFKVGKSFVFSTLSILLCFLISCRRLRTLYLIMETLPTHEEASTELDKLGKLGKLTTLHVNASAANAPAVCQMIRMAPRLENIRFECWDLSTFYQSIRASPSCCKRWRRTILCMTQTQSSNEIGVALDFESLHRLFSNVNLSTYELRVVGNRSRVRAVLSALLPWLQTHFPTSYTYKKLEPSLNIVTRRVLLHTI